ncbi:hypothetical protein COCNU_06G007050 [Cocos nucifera]|uniref:Uncharacterized protein n=1 Tax=Cocos nucifera TaxID=13894 RepID=A0A8K0IC68_COCNU|nr:hypothetical protein COCNU_06G007050 [Cocos nucifera]
MHDGRGGEATELDDTKVGFAKMNISCHHTRIFYDFSYRCFTLEVIRKNTQWRNDKRRNFRDERWRGCNGGVWDEEAACREMGPGWSGTGGGT